MKEKLMRKKKIIAIILCLGIVLGNSGISDAILASGTGIYTETAKVQDISETETKADSPIQSQPETETKNALPIQSEVETNVDATNPEESSTEKSIITNPETEQKTTEKNQKIEEKAQKRESETVRPSTEETHTTEQTLKDVKQQEQPVVYWDPAGDKREDADGQSAQNPIKDLEEAIRKAGELKDILGQKVTLYAMSPLEIHTGTEVSFDGAGINIASWEGRTDNSQLLFRVTGGTLTLSNMTLGEGAVTEKIDLISVESGSLSIGKELEVRGRILLNYQKCKERNHAPSIELKESLPKDVSYQINASLVEEYYGSQAIKAIYKTGESGDELLRHFTLDGAGTEDWILKVDRGDESGRMIGIDLKSRKADAETEETSKQETEKPKADKKKRTKVQSPNSRAAGDDIVYWNVNEAAMSPEGDRPAIPGGKDRNTGLSEEFPVYTWDRVMQILGGDGGTVVVMNPVIVGDEEFSTSGQPIEKLDGGGKITITQWSKYPTEVFIIPPEKQLILENIKIQCMGGIAIRLADNYAGNGGNLGKLTIGENTTISGGSIQTELNSEFKGRLAEPTIELTGTNVPDGAYHVYYSGINDNVEFKCSNVIAGPAGSDANEYLSAFTLLQNNTVKGWSLRKDLPDQDGDTDGDHPNEIELYITYQYNGIYLNGQKGNDQWFGGNCNWPVKTYAQAKKILFDNWDNMAEQDRVIYICDTVEVSDTQNWNLVTDAGQDRSEEAFVTCCKTKQEWGRLHTTVPETMVRVKEKIDEESGTVQESGHLTTEKIKLVYDYKNILNKMIEVLPGASYTCNAGTSLNGHRSAYYGYGIYATGSTGKTTTVTMNGGTITKKAEGVFVQTGGSNTKFSMNGGEITENSAIHTAGVGRGVEVKDAFFEMSGGVISKNRARTDNSTGYGGGVHISGTESVFTMSGGVISGNTASGTYSGTSIPYVSCGGGIYMASGTLILKDNAEISGNTLPINNKSKGAGVYVSALAKMRMEGGAISKNVVSGEHYLYGSGGGIHSDGPFIMTGGVIDSNIGGAQGGGIYSNTSSVQILGGTIEHNTSKSNGGGIYFASGGSSKVPILVKGVSIKDNSSDIGGGICMSATYLTLQEDVLIVDNTAKTGGGGVAFLNGTSTIEGGTISRNTSSNYGGGISIGNASVHMKEGATSGNTGRGTISGNTASQNGGGIYLGNGSFHMTEGMVSGNEATAKGGGIFIANGYTYIKNGTFSANTASIGSTCYQTNGMSYFMGGTYDSEKNGEEDYGFYMDMFYATKSKIYIDPQAMIMKDKIFLNTATSKLHLLKEVPQAGSEGTFPVNVNTDKFTVGSVVVAPANISTVSTGTGSYSYTDLTDVQPYTSYFKGGKLPDKTVLGGFDKNIILVGEGVYLGGSESSDGNQGTSPSDAVTTFERARELLQEQIASAKENASKTGEDYDGNGFEPFIYVCGEVSGPSSPDRLRWELDYDAEEFVQHTTMNAEGNPINTGVAQMKRFASYYGSMLRINNNGTLTIGKLLMDGNGGGVDGANNNTIGSMIVVEPKTSLVLENAIIQNNYKNGVDINGGSVTMKGNTTSGEDVEAADGAVVKQHGNWAVNIMSGGSLYMQDQSRVENSNVTDDSPPIQIPGYTVSAGGICVKDDESKVIMEDTAYVTANGRRGITITGRKSVSENSMVIMNGKSQIKSCNYGFFISGPNSKVELNDKSSVVNSFCGVNIEASNSKVEMNDKSSVDNSTAAINGAMGFNIKGSKVHLEMNNESSVTKFDNGIQMQGDTQTVLMNDNSYLLDNNYGFYLLDLYKGSLISMRDHARISNTSKKSAGIHFQQISTGVENNVTVELKQNANITNCIAGIRFYYYYPIYYVKVHLSDNARIGENTYGIHFPTNSTQGRQGKPTIEVNLTDDAIIGGESYETGNSSHGIFAYGKLAVTMSDRAKIAYNGETGIKYQRGSGASSYFDDTTLVLSGDSTIEHNKKDGIFVEDYVNGTTVYSHKVSMELKDRASVKRNGGRGILVGREGELTLGDGTSVVENASTEIGSAINSWSKISLGGNAVVDQEIYLQRGQYPITLLSEAKQKFKVGCADNFTGQVLVKPDGVNVTDASLYSGNFIATENFPDSKKIEVKSPYLMVEGENNVYIAGTGSGDRPSGSDNNNGASIGAPVASFERALEILKTLKPGANIIVCNYSINLMGTSAKPLNSTWGFDEGGTVTGANGTWTPKILRHEEFQGDMVTLYNYVNLTLRDITLDGNGEKFQMGASGSIIKITSSAGTLNLDKGSYIQNNIRQSSDGSGIHVYGGGKLNITGGCIQDNRLIGSYRGAGIYNQSGSVKMSSGHIDRNIINNTTSKGGAGIYSESGSFDLSGGTISDNQINTLGYGRVSGGAIYNDYNSILKISESAVISGNQIKNVSNNASYYARGTIYNTGTLTMTGGEISNNEVSVGKPFGIDKAYGAMGGGIYTERNSIGGEKSGNVTISGGNIFNNKCTTTETDISNLEHTKGGGIFVNSGTLKMVSGSIHNNTANAGAGIYYQGEAVELSGGVIKDNKPALTSIPAKNLNAGIVVAGNKFTLKGGGSMISDRIFLSSVSYPLVLGGSIYQRNRFYTIDCGTGFEKGSTVVKPDEDVILDTTGYLRYFGVEKAGFVLEKQAPNLVLKSCIYLDSDLGVDGRDGSSPDKAVKTLEKAKKLGNSGDYIIYVSGKVEVNDTQSWELPKTSWMSRYTGFAIAGTDKKWSAYTGPLVEVKSGAKLSIGDMKIYGRRDIDELITGDSIVRIESGGSVSLGEETVLAQNDLPIGAMGGAVNNNGGTLSINGASISQTNAEKGSAIYQNGRMSISGECSIEGEIYLTGTGADENHSQFIEAAENFKPKRGTELSINMENPYAGRKVISYPAGYHPSVDEQEYYQLNTAIMAVYRMESRHNAENILELQQKRAVYINGEHGNDILDGDNPTDAVLTLKKAYEILGDGGEGGVVIVVDTVKIHDDIKLYNETVSGKTSGYYKEGNNITVDAKGPVYFQRYAQPDMHKELGSEYQVETHLGTMIEIKPNGRLEIGYISFDGHSQDVVGNPIFASGEVEAHGPIFTVQGTLKTTAGVVIYRNNNVASEAKGSGIFIDGGTLDSMDLNISDVAAENGKGAAIYQNGICILNRRPNITGDIHLMGKGTPDDKTGSKIIKITDLGFAPASGKLSITMEDSYLGRPVVEYPGKDGDDAAFVPGLNDINFFLLEQSVTDRFSLGRNETDVNLLELQYRHRVYIDGMMGSDQNFGTTPVDAVRTLQTAYELLKKVGGGYLYIVDTVEISQDITLDLTSYTQGGTAVDIIGGTVDIRRYVVPDAMAGDIDYSTPGTHRGVLFKVKEGGIFTLQNIKVDGHRNPVQDGGVFANVVGNVKADAPLIQTEAGGILNLNAGAVLKDNDNTLQSIDASDGGAVANNGTLSYDGATLSGNQAAKGSGIYQNGYFTILYGAEHIADQEIYLTTVNSGTAANPVWGVENVIHMQELLTETTRLHINADHPVKGRNVVVYDQEEAYHTTVDAEYIYYTLGSNITLAAPTLYLVESKTEMDTLELQNYEVLDISVPSEIFLTMVEEPEHSIADNPNVRNGKLEAPDYTIINGGKYKTKISLAGFKNDNHEAGIIWDDMILVDSPNLLQGNNLDKKLYLAIAGNGSEEENGFKDLSETSLSTLTQEGNPSPLELGELKAGGSGKFTFRGAADETFFDKYEDKGFSKSLDNPDTHIKENARAKYQMIYKFELIR